MLGSPVLFAVLLTVGAPENDLGSRDRLTGDWWGARSSLEASGLSFGLDYTLDMMSNVAGGQRRGVDVLGNVDLLLSAEFEPLVGWTGGELFLYGLGNHGGNPSSRVGDIQALDHIEAFDTWKLYEAWLQQSLNGGALSALAGLYDLNSEFDVLPSGDLFVHSSPGIGADLGLSGKNGPSIFPTTSVGARLQVQPAPSIYLRGALLDGVPGDPDEPRGTQIVFESGDGLLLAGEMGFLLLPEIDRALAVFSGEGELPSPEETHRGHFGKYAVGVWGYTTEFDDFYRVDASGEPLTRRGTYGAYLLGEQCVYHETEDPAQGLSAMIRLGFADDRVHPVSAFVGGGWVYRGPFLGRDLDRVGFTVAAAHLGSEFRESLRRNGVSPREWEIALELTYAAAVAPWCTVQPDFQYIVNPGGDGSLRDAVVLGARLFISF